MVKNIGNGGSLGAFKKCYEICSYWGKVDGSSKGEMWRC